MKQTYAGAPDGAGEIYSWSGDGKAGEGRMTLTEAKPNELIRIKLEFERPMKATHAAEFTFKVDGKQTLVTWTMTGEREFIPKAFFLFMNIDKMLGGDFDKGLASMRSVVEGASKK